MTCMILVRFYYECAGLFADRWLWNAESGFRPVSSSVGVDLSAAFEQEVTKSRLKLPVVSDSLPISVNEFFSLYVSETAPFSFKK